MVWGISKNPPTSLLMGKTMFTKGQSDFLRDAQEWFLRVSPLHRESLSRDERFAILAGFPGTGKSTVVVEFIKVLKARQIRVLLAAPTHPAKNILVDFLTEQNVKVPTRTIHSVLGLKPEVNDLGEERFVQSGESLDFSDYDLLIIDEASMIDRFLWAILTTTPSVPPTLFVGDRYQLRPVNARTISPVFTKINPQNSFKLTEVVRHHGLLVDYLAVLRDGYETESHLEVSPADFMGDGTVIYCKYCEWLARVCATMQSGNTYKVLAYTNKNVDKFNDSLKSIEVNNYKILDLEDCEEYGYSIGEKLVLREPLLKWNPERKYEEIVCNNGTVVNVAHVDSTTILGFRCSALTIWWIEPETPDDNDDDNDSPSSFRALKRLPTKEQTIYVLDREERGNYQAHLSQLKAEALNYPITSRQRKETFRNYYQLRKAFTDVSRTYASTVHKAQGATYDVVFLYRDIAECSDSEVHRELRYVGSSRAKRQLVICR